MSAPAPPLSNIATPSSLPIGVLITNPHDPFQDLHDSFPVRTALPAEITVTPFGIYQTNSTNSKISNLRSSLADFLGLSRQCTKTRSSCLSAPEGERHQLTNHTQWFEAQCRDERTRHWIVDTWNKRNDIYLIVGLLVLTDANLVIESAMSKERGQQARISIPLGFTICNVVSSIGGVISAKETRDSMDGNFEVPGKFVFGIWHRKIKVGWLQSRNLDNSRLASTTWKPLWRLRGEEKEAGIGEEGEVEEDDDEEDLIDLELEQESEWGSEDEEDTESEHVRRSAATDLGQPNSLAPSLKRKSSQGDVGEVIKRPRMP